MAYLTGSRSQFPEQLDTILELFNLPPSQKDNAARYQYLATTENLSSLEQTELNNLSVILQDYLPDVETWNLFGDILINMQKFFKEGVEPFVNDLKDNALNEIEDKKQDIIDYMDSTEAGLIRNDIGVMSDSTIEGRSLIEKTNKLHIDIGDNTNKVNNLINDVNTHKINYLNPHKVTKEQIGLGEIDNIKQMPINGGQFTGITKAHNNTSYAVAQIRNIILSPNNADVNSMQNGDIWIKYK